MNRGRALAINTVVLSIGKFLPQLASLIILPIYTGVLSTTEYGNYDLINAAVYILEIIVVLQIPQAVFRFLIDVRGTEKEKIYITNVIFFVTVISLMASIGFALFFSEMQIKEQILLGIYLFLSIQYNTIGQIVRGLGNNIDYSIAAIINSGVNLLLVCFVVSNSIFDLNWGFAGVFFSLDMALLTATIFLLVKGKIFSNFDFRKMDFTVVKDMISYSWPMIPNTLSIWLINTCNKFIIRIFLGAEQNGIFAVAQKIPNIFTLAYSTFNLAWQESASITVEDADRDHYYTNVFQVLLGFLAGCMLVLIAITPILFKLLIRGEYGESYQQIPILYLGMFLSSLSSFYGSIYIAQKATKEVGISSMIGAGVSCTLNLVFVKWFGLYAASVSTVISYGILVVYRMIDIKKKKFAIIHYNYSKILLSLVLLTIELVLCYQRNLVCDILNCCIACCGFVVLNMSISKKIIKIIMIKLRKG